MLHEPPPERMLVYIASLLGILALIYQTNVEMSANLNA